MVAFNEKFHFKTTVAEQAQYKKSLLAQGQQTQRTILANAIILLFVLFDVLGLIGHILFYTVLCRMKALHLSCGLGNAFQCVVNILGIL